MDHSDYSRREFLKKFAALSSASLLLGMSGCGDPSPGAAYGPGPGPATNPTVTDIYFDDANGNFFSLHGNQSVPINTKFVVQFSHEMDETAPVGVTLMDAGNNPAALDNPSWNSSNYVSVTPSSVLLNDTEYTLSITDATSTAGKKLIIDAHASATFKTAAA